ncbi:MAG: DUF3987 domain-containing protein [Candidatus Cloacimonadota bacterium]|nr:DUF3987 domain-containing protein [Candidatus Cloacimonadota bacterium]
MEKTNNPLNLITFGKSVTRPEALETMPAAKLMAMLQNGRWRKPIEAIRGEKNPTLQKEMKLRLPYFVYGVLEGPRSEENVRQVNGIVFDFDRVGDFTAAKQKLMDAAPWFRWLFRSPVDGLKLMVPFSRPVTDKAEYTRIWKLLKAEIEAKSGLKADNTPDLCRACFLSWDDDVITCPEEWQKDLDEYLREAEMIGVSDGDAGVERSNNTSCSPCSQRSLDSRAGWTPGYTDLDEVQAKSAVEYLALRKIDRRDWIRCGIALYNHFGEDGIVYWLQFAYNPNYDDTPEDLRKVWRRLKKYPGVGLGTLFYVAEQYGWINAIQVPAAGKEVAALAEAPDKKGMGGAAAHTGGAATLIGGAATASTERPSPPAHTCTSSRTSPSLRGGIDPGSTQGQNGWIPGQARNDVDSYPSGDDVDSYPSDRDVSSDSSGRDVNSNSSGRDVNTNPSGGDGVTPSRPSTLSRAEGLTLADFPELLELFRRPQNIHLDREQLPEAINAYLDLVGRITDAQDGAKLTAFLPVVAANIGNRVYMYNAGTRHYCNIWAAIIGPSTVSRKTTVINQAMKMLQPFKESLRELSPKERNEQDIELSRVTQARLYNLLAINPNRLILQMELSAWMREMGKSYNAGMKQEITDMFDGKDRSIAKMEIDEHIAKPAFSIVGATTEDWFFQELREVADQRGGFLQRFIICIIQNIDVKELRLQSVDASECDRELAQWDEMLATFRALPDSRRLAASEEASAFRDSIYADLMKAIALNANDPQAAYCARIFDNYFWRFCILIFLLKNWRDLREAAGNDRLQTWFLKNKVDGKTAREAWYLCQYYYENTRPFLKQLTEGSKLDEERKILRLLQKAPEQEMTHSRLLNKSRMTSREFRNCIQSLIERQAILCHEHRGTNNKIALEYSLNPVLAGIDIS